MSRSPPQRHRVIDDQPGPPLISVFQPVAQAPASVCALGWNLAGFPLHATIRDIEFQAKRDPLSSLPAYAAVIALGIDDITECRNIEQILRLGRIEVICARLE